jgi:hypothetical protein
MLSDAEYQELKRFLTVYAQRYLRVTGLPAELQPHACLEVLEREDRALATRGLRQALNDIVAMCRHLSPREVAKIDSELRSLYVLTLSEVRRRVSKQYAGVVARGKINNETEYYLIRGILNDAASEADQSERKTLTEMVAAFELGAVSREKRRRGKGSAPRLK